MEKMENDAMPVIEVANLIKDYPQKTNTSGLMANIFSSKHKTVRAVNDISFSIAKGEMVGLIGPNGAGKSTTIKMLCGILVPTSGTIFVNNLIPFKNRKTNAQRIGVIFGQRSQLWWELPVIDSFTLLKHIYHIPDKVFSRNMEMFSDIFNLNDFLQQPVRQLSLGQRMRADITASLLHSPELLFLDEPTIGLDIVAKAKIRELIKTINKETKVTLVLTTHDMSDIEELCDRVLLIDKGKLVYNGNIQNLRDKAGTFCTLVVDFKESIHEIKISDVEVIKEESCRLWIRFDKKKISVAQVVNELLLAYEINDFTLITQDIDSIIRNIYQYGIKGAIDSDRLRGGE